MDISGANFNADERGASEVVGTILVVSLALGGALLVIWSGTDAINSVNDRVDQQNAQSVLQELDSRFSTLSSDTESPVIRIDLGALKLQDMKLRRDGYFNLTVNGNSTCSMNHTLSGISYNSDDGQEYLYQTGGVWSMSADSSTSLTSPSFNYRNGAIEVTLYNITGVVNKAQTTIRHDVSRSRNSTGAVRVALQHGECVRPDNVTIRIQSAAYQGWAEYLRQETDENVTVYDSNQTVRLFLDQSDLPRKVNDSRNTVVNLSEPSYMRDVTIKKNPGTISVDKNAGNNYTVFAQPLTKNRLDIGRVRFLSNTTNSTRRPMDVVMVLDESGSMDKTDGDGTTRSEEAQSAAEGFVGDLNQSKDRIGVVSYNSSGWVPQDGAYYRMTASEKYISDDFDAVNSSIQQIPDLPNGGTDIGRGLYKANTILDLKSNETRDKVIIALTDGVNNDCGSADGDGDDEWKDDDPYDCQNNRDSMDRINHSAAAGATVYTIGFGDQVDVDEAFLKRAANLTGGNYYFAANQDELEEVFKEIRKDINEQRFIARTPLSTNYTTASDIVTPQIPGATDIAKYENFSNVNDPTAPSKFSHSFAVSDDETVHLNLTTYYCDSYEEIQKTYTNNSNTYSVIRCADINESKGVKNSYEPSEILLDGDDASPLINNDPGFWENDINETLSQYPSVTLNGTTGKLHMKSNQAIVVFDLPDSRNADNKLAMLYQIGLAESEATAEGVINVQINRLKIDS